MAFIPYSIREAAANMNVNEPIPPLKSSPLQWHWKKM